MMSLTNAAVGAFAGEFIDSPPLAFLAGILLHLIADKIPHLWPKKTADQKTLIITDLVLSSLFILGLIFWFPASHHWSVVAGALGGVSVDFFFVILLQQQGKWAEWHTNRQPHKSELILLWTDVVLFCISMFALWMFR